MTRVGRAVLAVVTTVFLILWTFAGLWGGFCLYLLLLS